MPNMTIETIAPQSPRWLASPHGIHNCRTETLDISAFTKSTHYPDGYVRSGTPVAKADGLLVPYNPAPDGTETRPVDVLVGFIYDDQPVAGSSDFPVPLLSHGRIKAAKLPGAFTPPLPAKNATTVVFA